jgi:hypothetical protein
MEKLPERLRKIVTETIQSIDWNSFQTEPHNVFHYRYHKDGEGNWTLVIHPAVHEVIGGREDGALIFPKFHLSLFDATRGFDEIIDFGVNSREDFVWIDGMVGENLCSLEVHCRPPSKAKVMKNYHWYTGVVQKK